jgi:hypothetical protein
LAAYVVGIVRRPNGYRIGIDSERAAHVEMETEVASDLVELQAHKGERRVAVVMNRWIAAAQGSELEAEGWTVEIVEAVRGVG